MKAGRLTILALAAASAAIASWRVNAGEHWKFHIINKSDKSAVEFRTLEGGQWSANWIAEDIEPDDRFNMEFTPTGGECSVRTQIRFADGSLFDAPVDYCKLTNLYLGDDGLSWD